MENLRPFINHDLKKVYDLAKADGCKVYTFASSSTQKHDPITQIFVEDPTGRIGTCEKYFSGIQFSTIHIPEKGSRQGSGYGQLNGKSDFNNPEDYKIMFIYAPRWASANVKKYRNFEHYRKLNTILTYPEI